MSYNLKNKSIVMIAVMFAAMVAFSQSGYAQLDAEPVENKAAQDNQPQEQSDDLFGLDETENSNADASKTDAANANEASVQSENDGNAVAADGAEAENSDGNATADNATVCRDTGRIRAAGDRSACAGYLQEISERKILCPFSDLSHHRQFLCD